MREICLSWIPPHFVKPSDSRSLESMWRYGCYRQLAPFRLQTLATEGSELQAKEANRCLRQDRYSFYVSVQSTQPYQYIRHNRQGLSSLTKIQINIPFQKK